MIYQYNEDGVLLHKYNTALEASKAVNIHDSNIGRALTGKYKGNKSGGFIWKKDDDTFYQSTLNYETFITTQGLRKEDVESIKIWQTAGGEVRYSVKSRGDKGDESEIFFKELKKYSPKYKKQEYKKDKKDQVAVEISLPDLHFGRLVSKEEGEPYNLEIAEKLFMDTVRSLCDKVQGLNIEKFILPIGNDFLNSDVMYPLGKGMGFVPATTSGTGQVNCDIWQVIYRRGKLLLIKAIDYLTLIAPVDIVVIPGNHDMASMFKMGEILDAWYRHSKDVRIDNSMGTYKYYKYGKSMIMYEHGKLIKPRELALKILKDNRHRISDVDFFEVHLGHIHHEQVNEYQGVKVRFLPSLCPLDSWHKEHGYDHQRAAQVHIFSKNRGFEGYFQHNI